jgi:hypothetical protein
MEIRIGVVQTAKELSVEVEGTADEVIAKIDASLAGGSPMVWVTDVKGRRIGAAAAKIAYIEIDEDGSSKRVGFGR